MRKYPAENWKRLGTWVHDARLRAGFDDAKQWAAAVKRSPRMMQGLERGETVGPKTLGNVAKALGQDVGTIIDVLAGDGPDFVDPNTQLSDNELDARISALLAERVRRRAHVSTDEGEVRRAPE